MAQEMEPRETAMVTVSDGAHIQCYWYGRKDAPILILANSLGTTHQMWSRQWAAFGKDYAILCFDMRGHGASEVLDGAYSLDRLALDVLDIMDVLAIEKAHFCGVSLGGMVGQVLAIRAPERLLSLILSTTSAYMGPPQNWQTRINIVLQKGMASIAGAVIERWFTADFINQNCALITHYKDGFCKLDPAGYAGCCAAIRDMDLRPLARHRNGRTLVIGGRHDTATPPEHASFLAENAPNSQMVLLDAAHLANVEAPEAFNRAVGAFLRGEDMSISWGDMSNHSEGK